MARVSNFILLTAICRLQYKGTAFVHFHNNTGYASVPNCNVTHLLVILFITVFSLLCFLKMVMKNLGVSDELNEGAGMLII
jgi:hypothetical protein